MAIYFQNLDDFKDPVLVKQALVRARRSPKGGFFFFVRSAKALDGEPALVLSSGAQKVARVIQNELRKGAMPVRGRYYRDEKGRLVFECNREVPRRDMAEAIRSFGKAHKVPIPLKLIVITTPSSRRKAEKLAKDAESEGAEGAEAPKPRRAARKPAEAAAEAPKPRRAARRPAEAPLDPRSPSRRRSVVVSEGDDGEE